MKSRLPFSTLLLCLLLTSCGGGGAPQSSEDYSSVASSLSSWVESLSSEEELSSEKDLSSEKELSSEITQEPSVETESSINDGSATNITYWKSLQRSEYGETFRKSIQSLINKSGNKTIQYSDNNAVLAKSDQALNGKAGIIPFYHSDECATTSWNKEHVWPDSRGAGKSGPGSDPQMLRPTASSCNSARGNKFYGVNSNEFDPARCSIDTKNGDPFPLYEASRGEAARIIFYVAARYGNGSRMTLSNDPTDSKTLCTMGTLKYLYEWNNKYPVTAQEIRRNNYLHSQGFARNPFIDDRNLVNFIWDEKGLRTTPFEGDIPEVEDLSLPPVDESISYNDSEIGSLEMKDFSIDTWGFLPGAYPKEAEQIVTFSGIRFACKNVATFDKGKTLQIKKEDGYFANVDPIPFNSLEITLSSGELPLVYAGTSRGEETLLEPSNNRFSLQNARYFKFRSNNLGAIKVSSISFSAD